MSCIISNALLKWKRDKNPRISFLWLRLCNVIVTLQKSQHAESLAQWSITKVASDLKLLVPNKLFISYVRLWNCESVKLTN